MTREEIMERIKAFARYNKYTLSHNAEKIAEAKRRMGKEWFDCPAKEQEGTSAVLMPVQRILKRTASVVVDFLSRGELWSFLLNVIRQKQQHNLRLGYSKTNPLEVCLLARLTKVLLLVMNLCGF